MGCHCLASVGLISSSEDMTQCGKMLTWENAVPCSKLDPLKFACARDIISFQRSRFSFGVDDTSSEVVWESEHQIPRGRETVLLRQVGSRSGKDSVISCLSYGVYKNLSFKPLSKRQGKKSNDYGSHDALKYFESRGSESDSLHVRRLQKGHDLQAIKAGSQEPGPQICQL